MIKESNQASITVISVGDVSVEPILRKALAIGADNAIRINLKAKDSYSTAKEIANHFESSSYDLIIAGKESSDYNSGAVPAMIADMLNLPFVNSCNGMSFNNDTVLLTREIDGGIENIESKLPLIIGGQKGLVEESELKIPNMRGIMTARSKPLEVIEPTGNKILTQSVSFEKPPLKGDCKMIDENNVSELINELHNVAKVI